ncbi:hypothetical protein ACFOON_09440 [Novosphingobium piscinae]|uniref:Uncharacterized protein n=1 Tax=Novosphingobium piscinae TaxID=1507448 RepID=A0A7X1G0K7_9SPHN|nr:hypothetical protein [Novosphingobium piscinae]MBC2670416.1 hypothetical protein [Novosphingobium piscinae]
MPESQLKHELSPLAEAERLLTEALRLLDTSQAHLAAAYTATALDALTRYLDPGQSQH